MATSYEAWDKYDVDKVMQQLDEADAREEKLKKKQEFLKKKDNVVDEAGDSAEVLATRAAVAALKAKRLADRNNKKNADRGGISVVMDSNSVVAVLEKQAGLLQRKSSSIQTAMRSRGQASAFLTKNQATDALASYREALRAVDELDNVIPQLDVIETEIEQTSKLLQQQPNNLSNSGGPDHHACSGPCNHSAPQNTPVGPPSLPKSSDLKGIAKMLRVDCLIGIGMCHMERCHYASASESFRDAILINGDNLEAWRLRAAAFSRMGAPLIALLHWNKVVAVEGEAGDAQKELDSLEAELIEPTYTDDDVYSTAMAYLNRDALDETLARMLLLRHEADVIMVEGFYTYSIHKYRAILDTLSKVLASTPHLHHPALDQLRLACHVNIASGYLDMQKNLPAAVNHCLAALDIEPAVIAVRYRLGHAYRLLGKYDLATQELQMALRVASTAAPSPEGSTTLKTISTELDRVEFDRSELDLHSIQRNLKSLS
ncbi:hypothetical protein H310_03412 [Aphanomyces invadans]|uniref:peptidylprolyl isomerase n=1 Tax=Aphanomyces invadans TaxID=157072 RepID=A0A024UJ84_9STRA|nr:hypothetical protein H310_03412 [Aphanomyces invadans]ETW05693.1 hypothetical protein H310_03412 [Aphanomyces invadans]|eukprot:XP_008865470.1 hypothetical protein H310_03412 [Aphanomyces invadans]